MPNIIRRIRKTVTTETWTIVWTGDELPPFPMGEEPLGLPPPDRSTPPDEDESSNQRTDESANQR
jgi:hypothetical protein